MNFNDVNSTGWTCGILGVGGREGEILALCLHHHPGESELMRREI